MFKNFIKVSLIASLLATSIISCKKKDPTPDDDNSTSTTSTSSPSLKIDLNDAKVTEIKPAVFQELDANTVTKNIKISDATMQKGSPSSPTGESSAPSLVEDSTTIRTKLGGNLSLVMNGGQLDSVAGIYLKVQGSDEYFDIKKTKASNSNKQRKHYRTFNEEGSDEVRANNVDLNIEIPNNITEGKFCISYCVYTTDGQISNVISRCIEVQSFGGNLPFSGNWNLVDISIKSDDLLTQETIKTGEWTGLFDADTIACADNFKVKFESFSINFTANGGWKAEGTVATQTQDVEYEYNETTMSLDHTCGEITTTVNDEPTVGAWNYNETTQVLTIMYEGDSETENSFEQYKVFHEGNNLTLFFNEQGVKATLNLQQ